MDTGKGEGFAAFATGAAASAMVLAALVAGPRFGIIDAKVFAAAGDIGLGDGCVGCEELYVLVGSGTYGIVHGVDELGTAVGIDSMVAGVVGNHDGGEVVVLGESGCYGKHDAVAEGHDGGAHVGIIVVSLGDGVGTLEEG